VFGITFAFNFVVEYGGLGKREVAFEWGISGSGYADDDDVLWI
jgi:hypothetical protein